MKQKVQNYSNHSQIVPVYHFGTYVSLVVLIAGAIKFLFTGDNTTELFPWLFLLLVLATASIAAYARSFALRVQDRAIRAEENLRYFILTGKRLSQQLMLKQIIALRFASDEEFVALTERAIKENMAPRDIKKAVKNWRPDFYRA
jgi:hypothetical protein